MSSFDDDEALFEDIYDEEPKTEQKEKVTETKAPAATTETPASETSGLSQTAPTTEDTNGHVNANNGGNFQDAEPAQYQQPVPQQAYQSGPPPDKDAGKMFIGGLNWDTTEQGLFDYFSKYGEIAEYTIMKDQTTGRSRGFGFLTFRDPRAVDEVIKKDHILDGKLIDPKRAIAREEQDKIGKIFVGGIDPLVNEKNFFDFFSQFGRIMDAQLMIDKDSGRSRGFGFITFDSPEAVDRACVNKYLTLKGKAMEVKRAEPRGSHHQSQNQNRDNQIQQQNGPYGQSFTGATPEMMQEYWQRMQFYMAQQQQAAGDWDPSEQPQQQPLNPQQQAPAEENNATPAGPIPTGPGNAPSAPMGQLPSGPSGSARQNGPLGPSGPPRGPRGSRGSRGSRARGPRGDMQKDRPADALSARLDLPKGPRGPGGVSPPSGPSGGNGNAGSKSRGGRNRGSRGKGGYRKEEYHPYEGKGGRRN